ncbi:MAG: hypothetical protein U1F25_18700 [Rubrivivax sp.]
MLLLLAAAAGGGRSREQAAAVAEASEAPAAAVAPAAAARRVMSQEEAEDATAQSIIDQAEASTRNPYCRGHANLMGQAWSLYRQTGNPGYQRHFYSAMEAAERHGCL